MAISIDRRVSDDGRLPNGTSVVAVVRFVLDYEETARVEDVADYFGLEVEDVVAALGHYAQRLEEVQAAIDAAER